MAVMKITGLLDNESYRRPADGGTWPAHAGIFQRVQKP